MGFVTGCSPYVGAPGAERVERESQAALFVLVSAGRRVDFLIPMPIVLGYDRWRAAGTVSIKGRWRQSGRGNTRKLGKIRSPPASRSEGTGRARSRNRDVPPCIGRTGQPRRQRYARDD